MKNSTLGRIVLQKIHIGKMAFDEEKTNSFLFAADRCEHLYGKEGIIEQLNKGKTVISDRYLFSSIAYQSVKCGTEFPEFLNSKFPLPEILFFFEINPEISLKRVTSRNEKKEIYEKIDYQKKTAQLYENVISKYENCQSEMKIYRIDATKSIEEITSEILSIINTNK